MELALGRLQHLILGDAKLGFHLSQHVLEVLQLWLVTAGPQ